MKDFLAENPEVRLDATHDRQHGRSDRAGARRKEFRIGALGDSTLIAKKLAPHRRVLVASSVYLGGRRAIKTPEDLAGHECLAFALQPTGSGITGRRGRQKPPQEIQIGGHLRANDSDTLRDCVLSGLGSVAMLPWVVCEDLRAGRLISILPDLEWLIAVGPERAIWAVYPPKKVVSPKVKAFLSFLEQRFGHHLLGPSVRLFQPTYHWPFAQQSFAPPADPKAAVRLYLPSSSG